MKEPVFGGKLITRSRPMGASEEKRPSFWNSLGKNPKGDLPIQLTKVQTKERLGSGDGA